MSSHLIVSELNWTWTKLNRVCCLVRMRWDKRCEHGFTTESGSIIQSIATLLFVVAFNGWQPVGQTDRQTGTRLLLYVYHYERRQRVHSRVQTNRVSYLVFFKLEYTCTLWGIKMNHLSFACFFNTWQKLVNIVTSLRNNKVTVFCFKYLCCWSDICCQCLLTLTLNILCLPVK